MTGRFPRQERRSTDDLAAELRRLADGQDKLRESAHELRGGIQAILMRVELVEREGRDWHDRSEAAQDDLQASPAGRSAIVRLNNLETRAARSEANYEAMRQLVDQGKGALSAMRWLAGTSLVTTVAALAGIAKALGWW